MKYQGHVKAILSREWVEKLRCMILMNKMNQRFCTNLPYFSLFPFPHLSTLLLLCPHPSCSHPKITFFLPSTNVFHAISYVFVSSVSVYNYFVSLLPQPLLRNGIV